MTPIYRNDRLADRILVVRLSAMGDIIHAMPAIVALRCARPELQIGWLVEERWTELLCARDSERLAPRSERKPVADWVHVAKFSRWRRSLFTNATWREMQSCRREVRARNYQVAFDLQGAIRSSLAARASGAAIRIGSSQPREGPARMFYTQAIDVRGTHVVEHALSLASEVAGHELEYVAPPFPVDPAAEAWADQQRELFRDKPLAILNPGAGWGAKRWPSESFGAVASALTDRGMAVMVNHGPGEEKLAEDVLSSSGGAAIPLNCSVGELIALTRRARLFIGGDTGPMHLAAALRVPVVALFGPTRPERNGPFGTPNVVLRSPESVYNMTHTDRHDEGLISIHPEAVIEAADQLLGDSMVDPPATKSNIAWSRVARRIRVPLGFVFAIFYWWRARPTWMFLVVGALIASLGIALRTVASGQVKKNQELTMTGPYAYVRNPLYLGSIILAAGFAVAARDVWVGIAMVAMFVLIYVPVIRGEETFLRKQFPSYDEYAQRVPSLLPRTLLFRQTIAGFSRELYWQHREYNALLGASAMLAALAIKILWFHG